MPVRRSSLVLGILTSLLLVQGVVAHADTSPSTSPPAHVLPAKVVPANAQAADACLAAKNVWVLVEDEAGTQSGGCATEFGTGLQALRSAGFTVTGDSFITAINGHPASPSGTYYWSYWSGTTAGDDIAWSFSQVGASQSTPVPGTVQGWHFVNWQSGPATPPVWPMQPAVVEPPRVATPITGVLGDHTGDGIADVYAVDARGRLQIHAGSTTGKLTYLGQVGTGWSGMDYITQVADVDGDGRSDLLARRTGDDSLWLYRATGNGYLSTWKQVGKNWGSMDMIVPVGSLDGGPTQYVVARRATDGALFRYVLTRDGLSSIAHVGTNWNGMQQLLSVGDFTGDGRSDLLAIRGDGTLWMYAGAAGANIASGKQVGRNWQGFVLAFSPGDLSGDRRGDLVGKRGDGEVFTYANNLGRWGTARQILSGAQAYTLMA